MEERGSADRVEKYVLGMVGSLVKEFVGREVGLEEPLMEAGLDSLGAVPSVSLGSSPDGCASPSDLGASSSGCKIKQTMKRTIDVRAMTKSL